MPETLKLGLKLLLITVVATFSLALTQMITEEPIKVQAEKASNAARAVVLENAENFVPLTVDSDTYPNILEAHEGRRNNDVQGYAVKTMVRGYGGNIIVIVGIDKSGTVNGVRIAQQSETPGLGAKVQNPDFYDQFSGKSADKQLDANGVSAVTGATISSTAVTNAVNYAIDYFQTELNAGGDSE